MPIGRFPDPSSANEDGILAVGGDLHPQSLLLAYSQGIFPWPIDGLGLAWFCPDPRAILEFSHVHIPKSLQKFLKKNHFEFSVDRDFKSVIAACAQSPRPGQPGTWITPELKKAYIRFHELGHAHSVEVWKKGKLVGGIYGVEVNGIFSAESMFYREPNASKAALLHLIEHLKAKGMQWMDIQVMTPHMRRLGARNIRRPTFLKKLAKTANSALELAG